MGELKHTDEYNSFRSSVPQKKLDVGNDKFWTYYDAGPRSIDCPLICLPPASGGADVFFMQLLALSSRGYRVISAEYPVYWSIEEFCEGFDQFLDQLHLSKVHVLGASLGGFLAQKYAEFHSPHSRIVSIILCNSFVDTSVFNQTSSSTGFWLMPAVMLKSFVMGSFDKGYVDKEIADSIDFMVESLDKLSQQNLAARLTLNCVNSYVEPQKLHGVDITLIDVYDNSALSQGVREETYKYYPDARRASLKSGGNFPYLSRAGEVNVILQIHLRQFDSTELQCREPDDELQLTQESASNKDSGVSGAGGSGASGNGAAQLVNEPTAEDD